MELLPALSAESELAFGTCSPVHLFNDVSWSAAVRGWTPPHVFHFINCLRYIELCKLVDTVLRDTYFF